MRRGTSQAKNQGGSSQAYLYHHHQCVCCHNVRANSHDENSEKKNTINAEPSIVELQYLSDISKLATGLFITRDITQFLRHMITY